MIRVKNLTKNYGKNTVLDNVNLQFEKNKIYGILGRNGAGKTTLVNIITNRAFATNGIVEIENECSYENDKAQEKVFCITEKSEYPKIEKVSALFKWAKRFYPGFDMEYALKLAERFDLETEKKLGKLSTGYTTITKVILTLASNTPYMIFDEPVLGIDAIYREVFYDEMKKKQKELKNTVIICSHILDEVENVVDNVIVLKKGQIAFNGAISEITKKQSLQNYYLDLHKKNEQPKKQEAQIKQLKPNSGKVDFKKIKNSVAYFFNISWIQYVVIFGIFLLFIIMAMTIPDAEPGTEIAYWINLMVIGMAIHGYFFKYALYNGVSRKTYFLSMISVLLLSSVVLSIFASGVLMILEGKGRGFNLVSALYGNLPFLTIYAWFIFTSIFVLAIALFGMVLYQALTRKGRYTAMIILVFIILGISLYGTLAPVSLGNFFMFIGGLKYNLGVWFGIMWITVIGFVLNLASWLILRRTEIK